MCRKSRFGSCAVFLLSALCTLGAKGVRAEGEHLEPEQSFFTRPHELRREYDEAVVTVLRPERAREDLPLPRAAAIVMPSFKREYRIGLTADRGKYTVTYAIPEIMVFAFIVARQKEVRRKANGSSGKTPAEEELTWWQKKILKRDGKLPEKPGDIRVERCERGIAEPLAKKLFRIWNLMLRQVRYRADQMTGYDGVTYHFSMHTAWHVRGMGGQVWSPPRESITGRLAAITDTMRRYCLEGGAEVTKQLTQQADDLLKRLEG